MSTKIRNYYACANSACGFVNMFDSNIKGLNKLFILKGEPETFKSSLISNIGLNWYAKGFDVEFIHCSSDNDSLDGVIIPELKAGVIDGTAPHDIEPNASGVTKKYVNLGNIVSSQKLSEHKAEILSINNKISNCYKDAYESFGEAMKIHDEWKKIYIENIDFRKINEITSSTIKLLLPDKTLKKKSSVKHRFFQSTTSNGTVDYIQNLTEDISKRYFIKGRPGSGKSTMLKKIATAALEKGFDIEVYHCEFDADSIDMVILRELGIAIFDSTPPHEYYPDRYTDEIIDIYSSAINADTDEKYKEQLAAIISNYKDKINVGTEYLAKAKFLHDELKKFYTEAANFKAMDKIAEDISSAIGN